MIKYLLDTNICIYLMKKQPPAVIERFGQCRRGEIALSSITWAELCCGLDVHNSQDQLDALLSQIILEPFSAEATAAFGKLSQTVPNRKGSFDRMIAAHAIALDVTLITNNTADFDVYLEAGLRIENWVG